MAMSQKAPDIQTFKQPDERGFLNGEEIPPNPARGRGIILTD